MVERMNPHNYFAGDGYCLCFAEDETEKIKDLFKETKTNEDQRRASLEFLMSRCRKPPPPPS